MAWILVKNGEPRDVRQPTREAAEAKLPEWQAIPPPGGWTIVEVPDDRWSDLERRIVHRTSTAYAYDHQHNRSDMSPLTRENCAACAFDGYKATPDGPNVAGWARIFVGAGRTIPEKWTSAFLAEIDCNDNAGYTRALLLDIATFGVRGVEHVAVQRAVNSARRRLASGDLA